MKLQLKANGSFEEALLTFLETVKNDILEKKINAGEKTLGGCANFIESEMRKKAKHGVAVATDEEVYGLAIHFFEEDSIKEGKNQVIADVKKVEVKKEKPKMAAEPKKEEQLEGQMSLFSLLGSEA